MSLSLKYLRIRTLNSHRSINLGSCKEKDIEHLIAASVQAIPENVSDETNRKAWTLDEGSFSWLFNPDSGKFIAQLARGLCPWDNFSKGIKAEPYKLNVYGMLKVLFLS